MFMCAIDYLLTYLQRLRVIINNSKGDSDDDAEYYNNSTVTFVL